MNINEIIKAIEGSQVWIDINKRIEAIYEKENRIPSEEEYQTLRNMMICKTIMEM